MTHQPSSKRHSLMRQILLCCMRRIKRSSLNKLNSENILSLCQIVHLTKSTAALSDWNVNVNQVLPASTSFLEVAKGGSEMSITLRFSVGKKYVVLTLNGSGAEGTIDHNPPAPYVAGKSPASLAPHDSLKVLMAEDPALRDIPCYLQLSLLSALHQLQKEEAAVCPSSLCHLVFDQKSAQHHVGLWSQHFSTQHIAYMEVRSAGGGGGAGIKIDKSNTC